MRAWGIQVVLNRQKVSLCHTSPLWNLELTTHAGEFAVFSINAAQKSLPVFLPHEKVSIRFSSYLPETMFECTNRTISCYRTE